jgi:hypothetical protein
VNLGANPPLSRLGVMTAPIDLGDSLVRARRTWIAQQQIL